jgi:hypothetical protein
VLVTTGHLRRSAAIFAAVALGASVAAGCGGGSGGDTTTAKPDAQAARPSLPGREKAPSAAAFVGKLEKASPEQLARLCAYKKENGEGAAFVYFKKGYTLAFPEVGLPPKKVFDVIVKRCG